MTLQIELSGVNKYYGAFHALKNINLSIKKGTFVALVGPSGCGKSTLLRSLAGLETISAGDMRIAGTLMNGVPPRKRDVAMVFQSYALYPHMTVEENLTYSLRMRGVAKAEARRAAEEVAATTGLSKLMKRYPRELSGGQRQRVAIARALIADPQVLLLDEPTSALDVSVQAEILNLLQDLRAARNLTYILVSHNLAVIAHLCPQVGVMLNGDMVEKLSAGDLREGRIKHPHTEELRSLSIRLEEPA